MHRNPITERFESSPVAYLTAAALLAAAVLFGLNVAAEEAPPAPDMGPKDQPAGQCDKALHQEAKDAEGRDFRGPEGHGRPDGPPPPPRDAYGDRDQRDSYGPPPRRGDEDRGPERQARRGDEGDRGHRPPPPPRERDDEGDFRDGNRPPQRPDGPRGEFDGPGHRPGPPAFEDMDSNGDGSISAAEFKAFHENHRPPEQGERRGERGPNEGQPRPDRNGPPPPPRD